MTLVKLASQFVNFSPINVWQASSASDLTIAHGFYPSPNDLVIRIDTGVTSVYLPGGILEPIGITASGIENQFFTTPNMPASGVIMSSGTPWQNLTGRDIILNIPITFNGSQPTATFARGSTSPGSTLGTVALASGSQNLFEYYIPTQYYFTVTLSSGIFSGNATAQPV